jgi:hyperosmotically inducible protein
MIHIRNFATTVFLGALTLFGSTVSYADRGPSTMIETRPYETDGHITETIRQAFAADKMLKGRNIKIKTSHANVELTGTVKSKQESDRAAAIVKRTPAVDKVRNNLKVSRD